MNRIQIAITGVAALALAAAVGFGVSHSQKIAEESESKIYLRLRSA